MLGSAIVLRGCQFTFSSLPPCELGNVVTPHFTQPERSSEKVTLEGAELEFRPRHSGCGAYKQTV